jgi:hypothetical protein
MAALYCMSIGTSVIAVIVGNDLQVMDDGVGFDHCSIIRCPLHRPVVSVNGYILRISSKLILKDILLRIICAGNTGDVAGDWREW